MKKRYQDFYFTARNPETFLNKSKGILILHNSWTPKKYKNMLLEEFLHQDIMLSLLFSKLLNRSSEAKYELKRRNKNKLDLFYIYIIIVQ